MHKSNKVLKIWMISSNFIDIYILAMSLSETRNKNTLVSLDKKKLSQGIIGNNFQPPFAGNEL